MWSIVCSAEVIRLSVGLALLVSSALAQPNVGFSVGTSRAMNPDWIGANANLTSVDKPGKNDAFVKAVRELGIRTIRYPGGTIGNYWDWDRGWIDPAVPDSLMIAWVVTQGLTQSEQRYTLEDLHLLTQRTGTDPVFMLNMLSQDLEHALRNLRRAKALGMPIKYVELGNELYFDLPLPKQRYPTPEVYGDTCQRWITAIKQEFPQARCAVVGNYLTRHERQVNWTKRVLQHCTNADAVTFHRYSPSGLDGRREKKRVTAGKEGLADDNTATRVGPSSVKERQAWEQEQLQDEAAFANMLTTTQQSARAYQQMDLPPDMPIWSTEFNMRADHSMVLHRWSHTLVLAMYYLEFLDSPVTLTSVHNLVGHLFGQVHTDSANFSHISEPAVSVPYTLTAGGIATSLLARATAGVTQAAPIVMDSIVWLTDDRGATVAGVQGWLFTNEQGERTALIVNFGYSRQTMRWSSSLPGGEATSYWAELTQFVNGWKSLQHRKQTIRNELLHLPAHSITIIKINT